MWNGRVSVEARAAERGGCGAEGLLRGPEQAPQQRRGQRRVAISGMRSRRDSQQDSPEVPDIRLGFCAVSEGLHAITYIDLSAIRKA